MLKTKFSVVALLAGAIFAQSAFAEEKVDQKYIDESSYAVGVLMGKDLKGTIEQITTAQKPVFAYNNDSILQGVQDALKGTETVDEKTLKARVESLDQLIKARSEKFLAEKNKETVAAGDKFRAEFEKQDGVQKTKDGLLYKIEKAGEGNSPKPTDIVKVHYKGTLPDGKVFDSSYDRGEPVEFQLNQLIPAWVEGIPMLKKGGKMTLVAPPKLAYGEHEMGMIPANSTLKFEIELLDFKADKAAKSK